MSAFLVKLIRWGVKLGRWILMRLAKSAPMLVLGYMHGKIEDFGRRLRRARSDRRKRWLKGRILRWMFVARQIEANQREIESATKNGVRWLDEKAVKRLPVVAAGEKYRRAA